VAKPVARWPEAVAVEKAIALDTGAQAQLDRALKQGRDAAALAESIPRDFANAYSDAVLLGGEPPKSDPKKDEQLREAVALKEASDKALPSLRAAVDAEKRRVADARAVLTARRIAWADEQQEGAATALREYLAAALPLVARLMAIGKLRDTFIGVSFKAGKDVRPPWSAFAVASRFISRIPEQLQSVDTADEAAINAAEKVFVEIETQLKELSK
jgi:hypothetical protein